MTSAHMQIMVSA